MREGWANQGKNEYGGDKLDFHVLTLNILVIYINYVK